MTEDFVEYKETNWHSMEVRDVLEKLKTHAENGLEEKDCLERLEKFGRNEIPKGKKRSAFKRLLMQFHNVLIYVLLAAAILTAFMEHWIDTGVILAVIVINALIGFIQEGKAEKALDSIRKMLSLEAIVIRDGEKKTIHAEELVPGDVVLLKSGDKLPADIRLIHAKNFRVEESPLTGESEAVEKNIEPVSPSAIIGDRLSMAFSGTVVTYGTATGAVIATGAQTEIGKINQMISSVETITTPLLQQIEEFGKWLSVIILAVTAGFFAFGYFFREYAINELVLTSIGLIVAAIPEGLPAIITITLAIGVQRMAKRNAIIRHLPSVETLGAVNVICSDKTGTLTRNEMTAKSITTAEHEYQVEGTGYIPEGKIISDKKEMDPKEDKVLLRLLQTLRASNNSEIRKDEEGHWKLTGSPTEGSLLVLSYKAGLKSFKPQRLDSIPFESEHKYMATLNKIDGEVFEFITGAPEKLLEMCNKQYTADGEVEVDREYWDKKMKKMAEKGQRILSAAFQKKDSSLTKLEIEDSVKDNIFLGMVGIIDPPREEAIEAIKKCKSAGVEVKMITGDYEITAKAIGKEIGIGDGEKALTGKELEKMSDEKLKEVVDEYDVYARTSPEHKLRLVQALQKNGKICAMTGDGVNDAPALKLSNIGIAMGIKGTEVSKDASEMVLANDNFASIVNAIEEGRTVYDNIRKALLFILPTNGAESLVLMAAVLLSMVMPITPVQILWVNMVTAVTLALAISFEPMEENVMRRPPRRSGESILGGLFLWRIGFVSFLIGGLTLAVFNLMQSQGQTENVSRTIAVNTLVAGQLFYLFNCRRIKLPSIGKGFFNNKYAFVAVTVLIILQLLFVYTPFMNILFGTTPIGAFLWVYPIAAGFLVFLVVELEKFILNHIKSSKR